MGDQRIGLEADRLQVLDVAGELDQEIDALGKRGRAPALDGSRLRRRLLRLRRLARLRGLDVAMQVRTQLVEQGFSR
ncbi:MAG TPA: hypothetical protein VN719_17400 [Gemmatimonadales bacterium]|jgi:hypothetical protein|nr:hypothetical protein [Gemmatimonadales bacterium]